MLERNKNKHTMAFKQVQFYIDGELLVEFNDSKIKLKKNIKEEHLEVVSIFLSKCSSFISGFKLGRYSEESINIITEN